MHYFIYISQFKPGLPLFGTRWLDPTSGLIYTRASTDCVSMKSLHVYSKQSCCIEWHSKSTLGISSLCLENGIIVPINSSKMLLAISRESQLMIFLHSEVIENDHVISHTGWELIYKDWFFRQLNNLVSLASLLIFQESLIFVFLGFFLKKRMEKEKKFFHIVCSL